MFGKFLVSEPACYSVAAGGFSRSKGKKILVLFGLLILCAAALPMFKENGFAQLAGFAALVAVGLLVAIIVVALSRGESRRR
jgi:hypothetical protein